MSPAQLHVPVKFRRNYKVDDEEATIDGAVWLIGHMCEHIDVPDLGALEVLDFGCGVRFTQAFLNRGVPVGHYVGVDAYREMIEFLRSNVSDPRFEYVHVNAHNERYNPSGEIMSEATSTPIDGRVFDLICLFSVFTHLAPHDYTAMLKLLRRFAKPGTRLFYTLCVDELTEGGYGLVDGFGRSGETPVPYRDFFPHQPLLGALYSREYAIELVEGTGWKVSSLSPPDVHLQHHIVCEPSD